MAKRVDEKDPLFHAAVKATKAVLDAQELVEKLEQKRDAVLSDALKAGVVGPHSLARHTGLSSSRTFQILKRLRSQA